MTMIQKIIAALSILLCTSVLAEKTYYPPKQIRCMRVADFRNAWHGIQCEDINHMYMNENAYSQFMPFNKYITFNFIDVYSEHSKATTSMFFDYKSTEGYTMSLTGSFYEYAQSSDPHWEKFEVGFGCRDPEARCPITNLPL